MKTVPFCHLHFHTEYSLLDSSCKVAEAVKTAKELGQDYLAITDHGVLFGVIDFYKQARKAGIKPIIGCEVYIARNGMDQKTSQADNLHLVLLAEDNAGYDNLMHLVSLGHLEGFHYKPRIDKDLLRKYSKGLIGLSACLKGEISEACAEGAIDKAVALAREYSDILGPDNFYLELMDHGLPEQKTANRHILEVAKQTGLPLVATNDVHYVRQEHRDAHDVLICLQHGNLVSDTNRMSYSGDQFYMKSGAEMERLFPNQPEALAHTVEIARRCNVEFDVDNPPLHFPVFEIPAEYATQKEYLMAIGKEGLKQLYPVSDLDAPATEIEKRVAERFNYEVGIIEKTGFINYFLVVRDFIHYAKSRGIPVGPGRGSGAGSMLAYALGITALDPLHYNLIFERFLNPDRVSPPDFDIDFCQARRGEVIEYVKDKYGRENVAQIVTFGTLGAKTVIRDIGRVLGLPLNECDKLAKMIPETPGATLSKALDENPDFKRAVKQDPTAVEIMKYAPVLEGLPRHTGTHAAGVVIGEKPLIDILPLALDKEKQVITQFEMKPMEAIGLLKMDFLGLKTLTVIQEAVDSIRVNHGVELDVLKLPLDDQKTYGLLNRGDTIGVFQVESAGMRDTLRRIGLDRVEDLIAMIALYRPGPMQFIDEFIGRKHGKIKIQYDHPLLEEILKETYGIIVYQEQIQQAANKLAGFSLGEGDLLRRAMGKKDKAVMAAQREHFVAGCKTTNHIDRKLADKLWEMIEKFAEYGFNKSHSAAYGIIAYQTAFLKANYPGEFMAALLSSEMGTPDKLASLLTEAREMELNVRPPSVNESTARFRPSKGAIHFGMAGVKNVGAGAVEALVNEREANGPFIGLMDFCARMTSREVNRKTIESLIKCGAFDFCKMPRSRLFEGIEMAMTRAQSAQKDKLSGQSSLFEMLDAGPAQGSDDDLPAVEPWPDSEMLSAEKELIGFYISGHPLAEYEWTLKTFALQRVGKLPEVMEAAGNDELKSYIRIGGLIDKYKKTFTKPKKPEDTPKPYARFRIEGLEGAVNAVIWPDDFPRFEKLLADGTAIMVAGKITRDFRDELEVQVSELYLLKEAPLLFAEKVSLHLPEAALDPERIKAVKKILAGHSGPTAVQICLQLDSGEKVFIKADRLSQVTASQELVRQLEHLLGEDAVYIGTRAQPFLKEPPRRRFNDRGRR
jgi:DNA polymerase-3 subunit alpha